MTFVERGEWELKNHENSPYRPSCTDAGLAAGVTDLSENFEEYVCERGNEEEVGYREDPYLNMRKRKTSEIQKIL